MGIEPLCHKLSQTYCQNNTSAHQKIGESECEPFYHDIAHVIQNTKNESTCGIRTRDPCDTLPKHAAESYPIRLPTHCLKAVHISLLYFQSSKLSIPPLGAWGQSPQKLKPKNTVEASQKALWLCKRQVHRWQPSHNVAHFMYLQYVCANLLYVVSLIRPTHVSKINDYFPWSSDRRQAEHRNGKKERTQIINCRCVQKIQVRLTRHRIPKLISSWDSERELFFTTISPMYFKIPKKEN